MTSYRSSLPSSSSAVSASSMQQERSCVLQHVTSRSGQWSRPAHQRHAARGTLYIRGSPSLVYIGKCDIRKRILRGWPAWLGSTQGPWPETATIALTQVDNGAGCVRRFPCQVEGPGVVLGFGHQVNAPTQRVLAPWLADRSAVGSLPPRPGSAIANPAGDPHDVRLLLALK